MEDSSIPNPEVIFQGKNKPKYLKYIFYFLENMKQRLNLFERGSIGAYVYAYFQ